MDDSIFPSGSLIKAAGAEKKGMQIDSIKDWKKQRNENRSIPNFLKPGMSFPDPP